MLRHLAAAAVVLGFLLTGCAESPTSAGGVPTAGSPQFTETGDTLLYWVNNELEFEYDGASWRVWRNAAPATQMKVYRNGVLSATIDATYQGSDVSELRYAKSGHWMVINTSGVILDSDAGWDSDGGGDGGGDPCGECPPDGEPCLPCSGLMSGDDCTDERNDAIASGAAAITSGVLALLTGGTTNPVGLIFTGVFAVETVDFAENTVSYALCVFGGSSAVVWPSEYVRLAAAIDGVEGCRRQGSGADGLLSSGGSPFEFGVS